MRVLKTNLSAEKTMKASGTPRIIKLLTLAMKLTTGEEELINCRIGEAKTNPTIIEIHTPAKINNNKALYNYYRSKNQQFWCSTNFDISFRDTFDPRP